MRALDRPRPTIRAIRRRRARANPPAAIGARHGPSPNVPRETYTSCSEWTISVVEWSGFAPYSAPAELQTRLTREHRSAMKIAPVRADGGANCGPTFFSAVAALRQQPAGGLVEPGSGVADPGGAHVPASVGAERRLQDVRAQPVNVVAVGIDLRRQRRVLGDGDRRLDGDDARDVVGVVLPATLEGDARVEDARRPGNAGNARAVDMPRRDQAAMVEPRVPAVWRLPALADPIDERHEQCSDVVGVCVRI